MSAFPVKNFRSALENIKQLESKWSKSFAIQCRKHNMVWIEGITEELLKILTTKESTKLKVNAMYSLQYFVQLAEYPLMTLLEVYILPVILEIALFESPFQNTSQYFASQGYSISIPNIQQLSQNYITLAQIFIFKCSYIKPYRTFESSEMKEASLYKKAVLKLNKMNIKGISFSPEQTYLLQKVREDYLQNLSQFDKDSQYYVSYYIKKVEKYIIKRNKSQESLDFKKVMKYGDVFLTSEAIVHCCDALDNKNFEIKRNALLLIHDFVVWGDIEAIMMINYSEYIEDICNRISQVRGQLGMKVGELIYPQIPEQKQAKISFYGEFLICLQTWAVAIPKASIGAKCQPEEQQQFSPVFLLYNKLKNQKRFKFPKNFALPKQKKQLQQNLILNKERNDLIISQLELNAEDTLSVSRRSIKNINKFEKYKSRNSLINQQRESEFVTSSEMRRSIKSVQRMLEEFLDLIGKNNIHLAEDILQKLNDFCDNFQTKLEALDESIQSRYLQNIFQLGFNQIERINSINNHFQNYKDRKININKLEELVKYELTKNISNHTTSRFMKSSKSKKSKKSFSKVLDNFSPNLYQIKDNPIQIKNLSNQKYNIPIVKSQQVSRIAENLTERKSQFGVSPSTLQNKNQPFNKSHNFETHHYGFIDVANKQQQSVNQDSSLQLLQLHRNSQKIPSHHQMSCSNLQHQSKKSHNLQTDDINVQKFANNNRKFSQSQKLDSSIEQSIKNDLSQSQMSKKSRKLEQGQEELQKKQNAIDERMNSSESNFTLSRKSTQKSGSFMITSDNMKKVNQFSPVPSVQKNRGRFIYKQKNANGIGEIQFSDQSPHKCLRQADPKQQASLNKTNINKFINLPISSVKKVSSIQQQKLRSEMLKSHQNQQIFQENLSKHEPNNSYRQLNNEIEIDQNPGFEIVFKKKSNLKNQQDQVQQCPKVIKSMQVHGNQLKSSWGNNRSSYELNSKHKKDQRTQIPKGNIYTSPASPKGQSFGRTEQFSDRSSKNSLSSRRSLRRIQLGSSKSINRNKVYFQRYQNQNQQHSENSQKIIQARREADSIGDNFNVLKNEKITYTPELKQQFHQSSFADTSNDTSKIQQQDNSYYGKEDSQKSIRQKTSIYFQKTTSPKPKRVSFQNINYQRNKNQQYKKTNLSTPYYELKQNIVFKNKVQNLADQELYGTKQLRENGQRIQSSSKNLMQFKRSAMKSPQIPRYAVSPRSPCFRDNSKFQSTEITQRFQLSNTRDFMSPPKNRGFDLASSPSHQFLITPHGKLIKKKNYDKYLQQLRPNKSQLNKSLKKHLLRNKEVIHKNENIEIGFTLMRQKNRLKLIYFVTPQRPIQKVQISIQPNRKLRIKCSQNQIIDLQASKQYKIYISCEIIQFPYMLPIIQFVYKNSKKIFLLGKGSIEIVPQTRVQMLLPVYFIKFIQVSQISEPQLGQLIIGREVFRTQQFPLNRKMIKKPNQINDYIPNLTLVLESTALTSYCGKGCFYGHYFIFQLNFKMNHFAYIQAFSTEQNQKQRLCYNILEWFLVCMEELFIKDIPVNQ